MMEMELLDNRVERLLTEIKKYAVISEMPVQGIEVSRRATGEWSAFENGSTFGGADHWWDFRFNVKTPACYKGKQLFLTVRTGCEGLWDATNPQFLAIVNGEKRQAIDTNHTTLLLGEALNGNEEFDIYLEGYSKTQADFPAHLVLNVAEIDPDVTRLYFDAKVPLEAAALLPKESRPRLLLLQAMSDAMNKLDLRAPHSAEFDVSVQAAIAYLDEKLYGELCGKEPEIIANCVGHTHIDVAWLWDLYQTRHKSVRSFATVCELMRRYPDYKFMSSQPALYKFVKEDAPDLYDEIKRRIAEGRWETEGGMWVEADCNIAGGEALVRQFLYGKEFFRKEFGKDNRILWLPDVFGYSAALPQICKKCGIDYFMTTKLSWSEYNKTPYDTFMWKGLDGSEVLTHFIPTRDLEGLGTYERHESLAYFTTYNGIINPQQMAGGWARFQQKGLDNQFLVSYGYGDGGGGPTDTMLEYARRMEKQLPGMPKVKQEHALPFFEALEERVKDNPRLPKWSGELYLEYHRGTYTAMAKNKRNNRKIEIAMRECELWSELASKNCGYKYPADELHDIWETILVLQFHDILPGSSIKKVYDDSDEMYAEAFAKLDKLTAAAKDALTSNCSGDVVAFNSLSHERGDIVWFDSPTAVNALVDAKGNHYAVQHVEGRSCAYVEGVPALGAKSFAFATAETVASRGALNISREGFENGFFKATFTPYMRIASLIEKSSGRETAREPLNRLVCYENKPHNYDAWDMNIYYSERCWEVDNVISAEVIANGPVVGILRVKYGYMNSTIAQDITVYANLPRVDFNTTVDWKEQQYLLKAHFPVDVFYNTATYDVQFGNVQRATHKNTSWDVARFECCAHKWADVSEAGFGVALLNDCKYGYSIDEHSMALTLLKSSTYPNEAADQCVHEFTYSLMPHDGGWREAGVIGQAYSLNIPLTAHHAGTGDGALPAFASVNAPNVIAEAVMQQLDGKNSIVRLYECYGKRTTATLKLASNFAKAYLTDMLEAPEKELRIVNGQVAVELKPYEIVTLMFE